MEYYKPRTKGELVEWLCQYWSKDKARFKGMHKRQLYAVYFNQLRQLRGGRYAHLLSGVLSARMWIKQRNTAIEYLYEKYSEPLSTITWALDKHNMFNYPKGYLLTGYKWLIKNHPHDSICGCSIDQVHDEMKTRFDWAEQIGYEIFKQRNSKK